MKWTHFFNSKNRIAWIAAYIPGNWKKGLKYTTIDIIRFQTPLGVYCHAPVCLSVCLLNISQNVLNKTTSFLVGAFCLPHRKMTSFWEKMSRG